ncbi:PDZ domain containing protein [Nitzschia inconspicua]|uniref:PDZ domain containing protein n=1 Tax=Nitzschia inconspicua TaxID=303405 RepID=A0A9K3L5F3_9STRA|nr:PDZ domain containing protein [Nitzschia inconspicua]
MEETGVVTPPGAARTARNRVFKTFPRPQEDQEEIMDDRRDPSTPATFPSQNKKNDSPDTAPSTASEADEDGLRGPPPLRSKERRVNITMAPNPTASQPNIRTQNDTLLDRKPSPQDDEERTTDNDLPFDQASDAAARDTSTTSSTTAAMGVASVRPSGGYYHQAMSPLRNTHLSYLNNSNLSPVSTRFESIWMSSPEASPDRPEMVCSTEKATGSVQERTAPPSNQLPFIKKHVGKIDEFDERNGRFVVPTPRYSDPQPWSGPLSPPSPHRPTPVSSYTNISTRPVSISTKFPTDPAKAVKSQAMQNSQVHPHDVTSAKHSTRDDMQDRNPLNHPSQLHPTLQKQKLPPTVPLDAQYVQYKDEDTLFDFEGKEQTEVVEIDTTLDRNVKVTHKIRRRTRQRREKIVTEATDDDTSVENYGTTQTSATSLQERTHQAWKSRQKKNSSLRSKQDPAQPKVANQSVSFGKPNTVHHFEPTAQEKQDRQRREEEDASVDRSLDRSLNSEYTKTLESEVEDMIKDILFIGNAKKSKPGRRKFKDKPEVRRRLRQSQLALTVNAAADDDGNNKQESPAYEPNTEDNSTLPPAKPYHTHIVDRRTIDAKNDKAKMAVEAALNDSTYSTESHMSSQLSSQAPTRSTLLTDDRTSVLSASSVDTGTIESLQTIESFRSEKTRNDDDPFLVMIGLVEGGLSAMSTAIGYALGESETSTQQTRRRMNARDGERREKSSNVEQSNEFNIFESCMGDAAQLLKGHEADANNKAIITGVVDNLAQDMWYNTAVVQSISTTSCSFHDSVAAQKNGVSDEFDHKLLRLSSGSKVSILALHAAHSVHKLQGVEYDESIPIDMGKELKVCPVTLKLPLGIIFLENDGGCFVTKVSPDGSAARSGGVEVGDQLACINGASSLHMKVDDICDVIANSADPSQVELVFLRYTGPFRAPEKTLLETKNKFRLGSNGSFDDSLAMKEKKSKSLWRMNPIKSNKKEASKPATIGQGETASAKKNGGFRLFGRGKKSSNNE